MTVEGPAALAESGFVRAVLVPVARRKGIAVRYVSTDGAAALRDVRAGKAQVALSDNTAAEAAFIASSRSLEPTGRLVLYGDDVLIGPTRDPAAVAAQAPTDVAAALRLVAANGTAGRSDFIAGGIGQGESPLWRAAKVTHGEQAVPVGERWYHYGASDPAAVVRSAAGCRYASHACYALVDRAVFRRLQATGHARGLRIVVARNSGGAAGTNAALAHPVRAYATKGAGTGVRSLLTLLTSPGLQAAIGRYPAPGKSAYHAAATPLVLLEQGIPDLKGRLTEGTPGGNGLPGVRLRLARRARGPSARRPGHDAHRLRRRLRSLGARRRQSQPARHAGAAQRPRARAVGRRLHDRPHGLTAGGFPARRANMRACRGRSYRPMGRPRKRSTLQP